MSLPLTGSASNSLSELDGRRAPYFGWAKISRTAGISISKICSSESSERLSVPFFRYGPYRPFCAVMSTPVSGSWPTTRGRSSSLRAVARSTVAGSIVLKRDAVRGLGAAAAFFLAGAFFFGAGFSVVETTSPVSGSTACTVSETGSTAAAASAGTSGSGSSSVTYGP